MLFYFRYGFYGDVIKESEKFRWMGPSRYDFMGTKVFLDHRLISFLPYHELRLIHDVFEQCSVFLTCLFGFFFRSYEAEIGFLEAKSVEVVNETPAAGTCQVPFPRSPIKKICRANCNICIRATKSSQMLTNGGTSSSAGHVENLRWLRSKGRFLSVGAAVISCRNERAPDGLVADAHLSDGFLHLILVKDCPRPSYLW